jgi:hypothetical protein
MIGEGYAYKNTATLTVAIPTPAANTRIDRIVLRVQHGTTRTARVTRIAGTEGAAAPNLTQNAGTIWDVPLAQIGVTTAGVMTVTDQRSFCHFATKVSQAMLDNSAVGANQIIDGSVTSAKIADGTIQTTDLANDTVDDAKIGARVPQFIRRQGGDTTQWGTAGTTNITPGMIRMQAGTININNVGTLIFPIAFSGTAIIFVTSAAGLRALVSTVTASSATIIHRNHDGTVAAGDIFWLAIGPE